MKARLWHRFRLRLLQVVLTYLWAWRELPRRKWRKDGKTSGMPWS